jgi:uncharacterized protein (AIM24 family)
MIAMSPTITLTGTLKFSLKKFIIGGHLTHSTFTGPGELLLAPHGLGDIVVLHLTSPTAQAIQPSESEQRRAHNFLRDGTAPSTSTSSEKEEPAGVWTVAKDGYLASTQGVTKDYVSQGVGKGIFSGEGWFVYRVGGVGVVWITSFGAIVRKDVSSFPVFSLLVYCV